MTAYARLASLIYGDEERCHVRQSDLGQAIGFTGRSSVAKPLRVLKQHELIASIECDRITGRVEWAENGQCRIRDGIARQIQNDYVLLDQPRYRRGAAFARSKVGAAAYNLFRRWAEFYQVGFSTRAEPSLLPHHRKHLRNLVELVMREDECSLDLAETLIAQAMKLAHDAGVALGEPNSIYLGWNRVKALPGYLELRRAVLQEVNQRY